MSVDHPAPHTGPGVEPARRISLSGKPEEPNTVGQGSVDQTHVIDPTTLNSGVPNDGIPPRAGGTQTSPAPADPDAAARSAENDARIGELIQALGERDRKHAEEMDELRLQFRMQTAMLQNGHGSVENLLPANIDPDTPINAGQLAPVLKSFGEMLRANTIREIVGITPAEESAVYTKFPELQQMREPQKSEFLKEAVLRTRAASTSPNGDSKTTRPNGTPSVQRTEPLATRPAPRMVPHTEPSQVGGFMEDAPAGGTIQQLQQEYFATDKIPDRKERLAAKKAVMLKIQQASGLNPEEFGKLPWAQR